MAERSHIRDFTKGNITKQLITFAMPLFLSNLLQIVYNMVDMMVVGNVLGQKGLSAVAIGGDVSNLLTFVAMGFSSAGQVIIAQYIGRGERDKIGRFVGTMSGFLCVSSLVLTAVGLLAQPLLLAWMNTPREAYDGAVAYASVSMSGMLFVYGYNAVSAILRGMGDSKHPFLFISLAAVLNLLLDLLFVASPLNMGTGGAALATILSQAVSFSVCTAFLVRRRRAFALDVPRQVFWRWDSAMLVSLVKLGVPMAIKTASIQVSKLFVNAWVNDYGVTVSAFAGIANKVASIANLISMAMNSAGSTLVGQNIAAARYDRVKAILVRIAVITLAVATVLSVLIVLFPQEIFALFTDDADTDVLALSAEFVPIAVLLFFGAACRAIMNALINGSGNYRINFATAIFDGVVMRIGLAVLFGFGCGMAYGGFWLGDALAGFTPFVIGLVFYFTGAWKKPPKSAGKERRS